MSTTAINVIIHAVFYGLPVLVIISGLIVAYREDKSLVAPMLIAVLASLGLVVFVFVLWCTVVVFVGECLRYTLS